MKTLVFTAPLDKNFSQVTTLSGQDFVLTFQWNSREGAWYLDVADQDEVPIVTSRKITVEFPIVTRCKDPRRPLGILMAIDRSGKQQDPGFDDLGQRVQLIYIEPGDI